MTLSHELNFIDHLAELRRRIIICLGVLVIVSVGCFFIADTLLEILTAPLSQEHYSAYFFSPYEALWVKLKVAVLAGFIASSPVIFWQAWLFITPGLYPREKKVIVPGIFAATVLFLLGIAFCYYCVLPFAIHFLLSFQTETVRPLISIKEYLGFCGGLLLSFGFIFNLPLVCAGLTTLRIINYRMLITYRRYALVAVFIIAALITPPDVFTQLFLALPLIILYEVCIGVAWLLRKKQSP